MGFVMQVGARFVTRYLLFGVQKVDYRSGNFNLGVKVVN